MKRYDHTDGGMDMEPDGEYVRYDEAAARIAELESAIDKLAQCKGRFHTEANFKALIAVREKNLHK